MKILKSIKNNSFAVYGLGLSGNSVLKFLKKKKSKKNLYMGRQKKKYQKIESI